MRTSTSPAAGLGVGTSSSFRTSGLPNSRTRIALIFSASQIVAKQTQYSVCDFRVIREENRHLAEDRRLLFHVCFATRLGGMSGGKEIQGWRDSSHTAMVGAGKFGSAKLPMATATYPGKPSPSQ